MFFLKDKFIKKHKLIGFKNYLYSKLTFINLSLHLGHLKSKWNRFFKLFIFSFRNKIIIFNVDYLYFYYKKVINFLNFILINSGKLLFLSNFINKGVNSLNKYILKKYKIRKKHSYFDGFYIGGLLSNYRNVYKIKKIKNKKIKYVFKKKLFFGNMPSLIVISSSNSFFFSFLESINIGLPTTSLIDSDLEYRNCLYPLIGNNDSIILSFFFSFIFYVQIKISLRFKKRYFFIIYLKFFKFILKLYIVYLFIFFFFFSKYNSILRVNYKKKINKFNFKLKKNLKNLYFFFKKKSFLEISSYFFKNPKLTKSMVKPEWNYTFLYEKEMDAYYFFFNLKTIKILFNSFFINKFFYILLNGKIFKTVFFFKKFFLLFLIVKTYTVEMNRSHFKLPFLFKNPREYEEKFELFNLSNQYFRIYKKYLIKLRLNRFFKYFKYSKLFLKYFKKKKLWGSFLNFRKFKKFSFFQKILYIFKKKKKYVKKKKNKFFKRLKLSSFYRSLNNRYRLKRYIFFKMYLFRVRFYLRKLCLKFLKKDIKFKFYNLKFLNEAFKNYDNIPLIDYDFVNSEYDSTHRYLKHLSEDSLIKLNKPYKKRNLLSFFVENIKARKVYLILLRIFRFFFKTKIYHKYLGFNYNKYYKLIKFLLILVKEYKKQSKIVNKIVQKHPYRRSPFRIKLDLFKTKKTFTNKIVNFEKFDLLSRFFFQIYNGENYKYFNIFSNFIFFDQTKKIHDILLIRPLYSDSSYKKKQNNFKKNLLIYFKYILNFFIKKRNRSLKRFKKKRIFFYYLFLLYLKKNIKKRGYFKLIKYYKKKILMFFSSFKFVKYLFNNIDFYYSSWDSSLLSKKQEIKIFFLQTERDRKFLKFSLINLSKKFYFKYNPYSKILSFFGLVSVNRMIFNIFYLNEVYLSSFSFIKQTNRRLYNFKILLTFYQKIKRELYIYLYKLKKKVTKYKLKSLKFFILFKNFSKKILIILTKTMYPGFPITIVKTSILKKLFSKFFIFFFYKWWLKKKLKFKKLYKFIKKKNKNNLKKSFGNFFYFYLYFFFLNGKLNKNSFTDVLRVFKFFFFRPKVLLNFKSKTSLFFNFFYFFFIKSLYSFKRFSKKIYNKIFYNKKIHSKKLSIFFNLRVRKYRFFSLSNNIFYRFIKYRRKHSLFYFNFNPLIRKNLFFFLFRMLITKNIDYEDNSFFNYDYISYIWMFYRTFLKKKKNLQLQFKKFKKFKFFKFFKIFPKPNYKKKKNFLNNLLNSFRLKSKKNRKVIRVNRLNFNNSKFKNLKRFKLNIIKNKSKFSNKRLNIYNFRNKSKFFKKVKFKNNGKKFNKIKSFNKFKKFSNYKNFNKFKF